MTKCPNCGRKTLRTEDWACQWCGYPLLSKSYKKITKTYREFQEDRRYGIGITEPGLKTKTKPEPETIVLRKDMPRATNLILLCMTYLVALGGAEYVTHYMANWGGIIFHFVILISLVTHSAVAREEAHRGLWLALGLAPLIRIVSLTVPVAEISEIYWYIIIAVPVFVGIITVTRNLNYSFDDIGLNGRKILIQILVAVAGIGLGIIDYTILKPEALVSELTVQIVLLPALILLISTGFVEELAFRGVMQKAARVLGSWGWVYIAMIYAVLQIGHGSISHGVFALVVALFWGWVVKKTGSALGVSLSHGLLNVVLYLILPNVELYLKFPGPF